MEVLIGMNDFDLDEKFESLNLNLAVITRSQSRQMSEKHVNPQVSTLAKREGTCNHSDSNDSNGESNTNVILVEALLVASSCEVSDSCSGDNSCEDEGE